MRVCVCVCVCVCAVVDGFRYNVRSMVRWMAANLPRSDKSEPCALPQPFDEETPALVTHAAHALEQIPVPSQLNRDGL